MGFFQFGSLFIFVGQKLTKMTKADIVKQLAQETGVEAVTVLAVVEGFMEEVRASKRSGGFPIRTQTASLRPAAPKKRFPAPGAEPDDKRPEATVRP